MAILNNETSITSLSLVRITNLAKISIKLLKSPAAAAMGLYSPSRIHTFKLLADDLLAQYYCAIYIAQCFENQIRRPASQSMFRSRNKSAMPSKPVD
jgi:hypothetical protein